MQSNETLVVTFYTYIYMYICTPLELEYVDVNNWQIHNWVSELSMDIHQNYLVLTQSIYPKRLPQTPHPVHPK